MIYADAQAPEGLRDLTRARRNADFVIRHMVGRDRHGIYFKPAVDGQGREVPVGRGYVFSFEQAYPLAGLIGLVEADKKANSDLLPFIRRAAQDFWTRFHDPTHAGLFYYYNLRSQDHRNDAGAVHKSYQSMIYPVSSFLFALRNLDHSYRPIYDWRIRELLDLTVENLVERRTGGFPTGWLRERLNSDFSADESYQMCETGHITQLSWVLIHAVDLGIAREPGRVHRYMETAFMLLESAVHRGVVAGSGAVYDAFNRSTGRPWAETDKGPEARPTSAWWSTLEAIMAFAAAKKHFPLTEEGKARVQNVLDRLADGYFQHFLDPQFGGEFYRIDSESGAVIDSTKGHGGKSAYHLTEAYRFLFLQPGWAR